MLNFREINFEKDIEEIVQLINAGLDPSYTEDFFRWKHVDNPFGKSYGLLATQEGRIVALRMFMFWDFSSTNGNEKISAIRPVDTLVDKNQRGKGLFKKLTLQGLEECQNRYDLVFNTPNDNSLPGYLKMGWERLEHVNHFKLGVTNPFVKSLKFKTSYVNEINRSEHSQQLTVSSTLSTNKFLIWRYKDQVYKLASFELPGHYLIYRKSKINGMPALIIYEIIGKPELIGKMMNSLGKKKSVAFVYFYYKDFPNKSFLKVLDRKKPVVVYKNDTTHVSQELQFSLGDLEGKL